MQQHIQDIRNLISALDGAYVYRGRIFESEPTQQELNDRLVEIMSRSAIMGDVLIDDDDNEWYFNGSVWDNYGQFIIGMASIDSDGLMSKEDFVKLSNLYNKATLDGLLNDRYTKAETMHY